MPRTAPACLAGTAVALPSLYLAALAVAARAPQHELSAVQPPTSPRLQVLVPAHNESTVIGRCLDSLAAQDCAGDRFEVVVVADNCTDNTAELARSHGATVLERHDLSARGKGQALRWAMDRLLIDRPEIDAFVVVDADSVTDPGMLSALARAHAAGASVAQADYEALVEGDDPRSQLRAAAFLLFHRVRFSGKARLGLPCSLVGNGMLFSREVCLQVPWTAFSEVEDLEYGLQLRLAGVEPVFVPDAHLVAPVATSGPAAEVQRTRWEGGRARIVRRYLPRLVRETLIGGRTDLWDAAADLAVPPLGLLAAGIVAGGSASSVLALTGQVQPRALIPWAAAGAALVAHVVVGLRAADAPPHMRRALAGAPRLILSEMAVRARTLAGGESDRWVRTPRRAEPREIS